MRFETPSVHLLSFIATCSVLCIMNHFKVNSVLDTNAMKWQQTKDQGSLSQAVLQ